MFFKRDECGRVSKGSFTQKTELESNCSLVFGMPATQRKSKVGVVSGGKSLTKSESGYSEQYLFFRFRK